MKTPDSDIRVFLQTLTVAGASIFDFATITQKKPYIHLSALDCDNFNTATENLYTCNILFDIVTSFRPNTGGRKESDKISESLLNLLNDNRATIGSFKIVRSQLLTTNYVDEYSESETIIRKLMRVEMIVEQIN